MLAGNYLAGGTRLSEKQFVDPKLKSGYIAGSNYGGLYLLGSTALGEDEEIPNLILGNSELDIFLPPSTTNFPNVVISGTSNLLDGDITSSSVLRGFISGNSSIEADNLKVSYKEVQKTFLYKVYKNNIFVGTWDNTDDFSFREQINSSGSEVTCTLSRPADNFGEDEDVALGNRVDIYVADQEYPNGQKIFSGKISRYKSDFATETVTITLLGVGFNLSKGIFEAGDNVIVSSNNEDSSLTYGHSSTGFEIEHDFNAPVSGGNLIRLEYKLKGLTPTSGYIPGKNEYIGQTVTATVYSSQLDLRNKANPLGSATAIINSVDLKYYSFIFGTPIQYNGADTIYVNLSVSDLSKGEETTYLATSSSSTIAGTLYRKEGSIWFDKNKDPCFRAIASGGNTTITLNSYDPSDIAKIIIDDYNTKSTEDNKITYTESSIDATGTEVSYTFNTNTHQEALDKMLELCPENWYYYIDQAERVFHLHKKGTTYNHKFTIGKDVSVLNIQKNAEVIANLVYFVGGGTPALFRKYANQSSINKYGVKSLRVKDGRVTQQATADLIASKLTVPVPEILITLAIMDNNFNQDSEFGYDIESIKLGQIVQLGNTGQTASAKYDISKYNDSYYNYDGTNISTVLFQITDKTYNGDLVTMSLSSTPPDISKRIRDIKRNVEEINQEDNPTSPEF